MKITKVQVLLKSGRKAVKFTIYHNLQDDFGLSFNDALQNWIHRYNQCTAESLRDYIKGKVPDCICLTESEFQNLNHDK